MPSPIVIESLAVDPPTAILEASQGVITLGREPENTIVIDSVAVSRRHASLFTASDHWLLKDFESSNGTWVNGTKVTPGGIRLIRDGDVIRLADFVLRVSETNPRLEAEWRSFPPSLIVFYKEQFESEFPLALPGAAFQIGGEDGDYFIDGAEPSAVFLRVTAARGSVELTVPNIKEKVSVNGMLVSGIVSVTDRDELEVPPYTVIVNFPASAITGHEYRARDSHETPKGIHAYQQEDSLFLPEDDGWVSEAARRKASLGQRYLFGTENDSGMERTMSVQAVKPEQFGASASAVQSRSGYEMSSSQKFSTAFMDDDVAGKGIGETLLVVFGVVIFILLVVFVIYMVATLG